MTHKPFAKPTSCAFAASVIQTQTRQNKRRKEAAPPPPPTPPAFAASDRIGFIGDSMTYGGGMSAYAYAMWLMAESNGLLHFPQTSNMGTTSAVGGNLGVSGQTPAQYLARLSNIQASNLNVAIIGGTENAGTTVTAGDLQTTFGSIFAGLSGLKCIFVTPVARTKTVMASPTLIARADAMDAWFAAASGSYPNVRFLPNTWSGVELTTFNGAAWVAGADSYDGIHQNPRGAKEQAVNIWADIVAAGGVPAGDAYSAPYLTNLNSASAMTGTTGTFTNMTGQLPTGYVGSNTTGATVTASIVTRDGRNYIRLAISGTCTTADRVRIRRSITHTHALGDVFVNMARLKYSAAAGGVPVGLRSIGLISHSNARWMTASYGDTNGLFAGTGALSERVVRSQANAATAGGSSYTVDLDIRLVPVAVDLVVEFADLRSFNLTVEGFA